MHSTPVFTAEIESTAQPTSRIDLLVQKRLKEVGVLPPPLCSDATFLRRAFLDVIGTLPTAAEARTFLATPDRGKLIDSLLDRDEFADYWSMKWSDLLRVKSEFPINLWPLAAQGYHRWIHDQLRNNIPYDQFARKLLLATGSNFRDPECNFYRAVQSKKPLGLASAVALTFMGTRLEKWPKARQADMAAFFGQVAYKATGEWKEEIVYQDPSKPMPRGVLPDGKAVPILTGQDPRDVFANWLISPTNPWFARSIANRVWCWLLGRGIVHEPDDLRPDNPASNPALLTYLEQRLVAAHWDIKSLFREILKSDTYQRSSVSGADRQKAEANFAVYTIRRLEAEVLIDALNEITGSTETYSSATPEPFTWIPPEETSTMLADGSITSPFLEMFGRPPRDTGLEAERVNRITSAQRLHLLNSSHMLRKIERGPKMVALLRNPRSGKAFVEELYLTILSRYPTPDELKVIGDYSKSSVTDRRSAAIDLAWALFNTAEFLYRH